MPKTTVRRKGILIPKAKTTLASEPTLDTSIPSSKASILSSNASKKSSNDSFKKSTVFDEGSEFDDVRREENEEDMKC